MEKDNKCGSENVTNNLSFGVRRCDSKMLLGQKRSGMERENDEGKRIKMRDLQSVFRSEEEMSQVTEERVPVNSDLASAEREAIQTLSLLVDHAPNAVNVNSKVHVANSLVAHDDPSAQDANNVSLVKKDGRIPNHVNSRGIGFDLNTEDVSCSGNQEHFYPYKNQDLQKYRDMSECGSTTGPLEEKDPMRVWKEMKQNGFLSSSHGGIPLPKQRVRKSKDDILKKKMEVAKREEVDRFSKIAARSGLLNDLNPGIINHVRNSKQVRSIIEALVGSEKLETGHAESKQASKMKSGSKEINERKDLENMNELGVNHIINCDEDGCQNTLTGNRQESGYSMFTSSRRKNGNAESSTIKERICGRTFDLNSNRDNEDDILVLTLSSSAPKLSENCIPISNEESQSSFSSLSVNAASVASQWLELIHQDVKGRLAALRRSKKRVQSVIQTELPLLLTKEFSSNQENDPYIAKRICSGYSTDAIASIHQARWSALFDQMVKALLEEEKQLEGWLNQVREMQLHCEKGLQHDVCNLPQWLPSLRTSESPLRLEKADKSDRELAVRAAAASIYSTCNFISSMDSMENVSCFLSH